MAVTIVKRPFAVIPAHNDAWFYATSSQTAQPNFKYYITITVNSIPYSFEVDKDDNDECYWNMRTVMEKYVPSFYPHDDGTNGGWQDAGLVEFTVNIGEKYGSPAAVTTGSDITIKAWNGSLTVDERRDYEPENYGITPSEINWLNNFDTELTTFYDKDLVFYFLAYSEFIDSVTVRTYNSAGSLLNTFTIPNPYNSILNCVCINLGPSYLNQHYNNTPGDFTGITFSPLFLGSEAYYTVTFNATSVSKMIRVNIEDCEPKFENKVLFYLNRYGAYDPVNLYGNHEKDIVGTRTFYKGLTTPLQESSIDPLGNVYLGPNPQTLSRKVLSSTYQTNQTLKSDWLTPHQRTALQDLITTPKCFLNLGVGDYKPLSPENLSYKVENPSEKLFNLSVNLNEGITERRQLD